MENLPVLSIIAGMAEWALDSMTAYGVPVLVFLTFIGSLGIPFPVTLVIIAAGALARQGAFDWFTASLACLAGSTLADHCEYIIGHFASLRVKQRYENNPVWQRASSIINRWGGWAITLTRFWLTPLAPAINLLSGIRYPYSRFLFFDLIGQLLWVFIYGGLGFLFASQWELVHQFISEFTGLSVFITFLACMVAFFVLHRKKSAHP